MITRLRRYYNQQMMLPTFLGIFCNPFFIARYGLKRAIIRHRDAICGRVLDVGCGRKPYQSLFSYESYTGMDVEQSGHTHEQEDIDVFYDGTSFPFPADHFDSMLCNQVLEHVFTPDAFVAELHRTLKPGGTLLLTVPFVWDEHEQPYDYARYSSFGLRSLLEKQGFEILLSEKTVGNVQLVFQLWNAYLYKVLHTRIKAVNLLFAFLLMSPATLLGLVLSWVLPRNGDLYLDNVILAQKKSHV